MSLASGVVRVSLGQVTMLRDACLEHLEVGGERGDELGEAKRSRNGRNWVLEVFALILHPAPEPCALANKKRKNLLCAYTNFNWLVTQPLYPKEAQTGIITAYEGYPSPQCAPLAY